MLSVELATGLGTMVLTIIIHALFMVGGANVAKWRRSHFGYTKNEIKRAILISVLTVLMFLAVVLEAWLWALLYFFNPLITTLPGKWIWLPGPIRTCSPTRNAANFCIRG